MEKKLYVSPQMEVVKITSKPLMQASTSSVPQGTNDAPAGSRGSWDDED